MDILKLLLESPVETTLIAVGLLLLIARLINVPPIPDPTNRRLAFVLGSFLFTVGLILHLYPVIFPTTSNGENSTTTEQSTSPQPKTQYTLQTFRKDGDRKTYKSSFSSSENIFAEFDLSNPDIEKNRKLLRWTDAGDKLEAGRRKWVDNSGEIELGTFQPGSYEVRAFFLRGDRSYGLLTRKSFEVVQS